MTINSSRGRAGHKIAAGMVLCAASVTVIKQISVKIIREIRGKKNKRKKAGQEEGTETRAARGRER